MRSAGRVGAESCSHWGPGGERDEPQMCFEVQLKKTDEDAELRGNFGAGS